MSLTKEFCNLGHLFVTFQANLKFQTHLHHHKGPNLTKGHVSLRLLSKLCPFMDFGYKRTLAITDERWPLHAGLLLCFLSGALTYCINWHIT